jgi:hypothetical protein
LREENQLLAERLARMEAFLANTVAPQRAVTPPESVSQYPQHMTALESLAHVSESAPSIRASFSNLIQTEPDRALQQNLDMTEIDVDAMHITPPSHDNMTYAEFQTPESQPSLSPSATTNNQADNISLEGSLTRTLPEKQQSINSPQNVGIL